MSKDWLEEFIDKYFDKISAMKCRDEKDWIKLSRTDFAQAIRKEIEGRLPESIPFCPDYPDEYYQKTFTINDMKQMYFLAIDKALKIIKEKLLAK